MRLIFYIIIGYIVYVVAKKFLAPSHSPRGRAGQAPGNTNEQAGEPVAEETVLDPVCGSYLAKGLAVKINKDGKAVYFCGEQCRDKYTSEAGG
ncbi:MAG: hypothetical protein IME98_05715 [Proteobacteria bacterium]|nr:hypothetical protein [Pseudomonadota bacterium]